MIRAAIPTEAGVFIAHFSRHGLARLDFPPPLANVPNPFDAFDPIPAWIEETKAAITAILSGKHPQAQPPLDVTVGTELQRNVWAALKGISTGRTKTYGEIAREIGSPEATRAVGRACGANPIPLLIPCHRVVASGGRLGGFSGGLDWKKRLLAIEGVVVHDGELPL